MSLSALSPALQEFVEVAAIPHWFDILFLEALRQEEPDEEYAQLLSLSFVEQLSGKGYAIHERTRTQLLNRLWTQDPDRFRQLSQRAPTTAPPQTGTDWQAEALYHQLVSDPETGINSLRQLATQWANYQFHTYDDIERTLRLASEQIEAGRLTGLGADWTRLWQAKLALMTRRPEQASVALDQINNATSADPRFSAERDETRGDALAATDADPAEISKAYLSAYTAYQNLPDNSGQLDAYLLGEKMRRHGIDPPEETLSPDPPPPKSLTKNEVQLIDNIRYAWIEGVLDKALNQSLDVGMARDSATPANLLYHRPQAVDAPITGQPAAQPALFSRPAFPSHSRRPRQWQNHHPAPTP